MAGSLNQSQAVPMVQMGRFVLGSALGRGGLSAVFESVDPIDQRAVALKVMRPELVDIPGARLRFLREFEILQQVASLHVVKAHEYFETDDGRAVLVLERAAESLSDRMGWAQAAADVRHAAATLVVGELRTALSVVHCEQIVFGDVGPRNLLIVNDAPIGGGARSAGLLGDHERCVIADPSLELTAAETGTGPWREFGTPRFSPPEQNGDARPLTAAVDIYAATATLWFVLFGRPPHRLGPKATSHMAPLARSFFEIGMNENPMDRFHDIDAWYVGAQAMIAAVMDT